MLRPDKDLILEASEVLGIDKAFIEKDWFITQLLRSTKAFHGDPRISLVFSGGTALSKAHRRISRFSEDVDFRIHSDEKISRSARSRWRKELVVHLRENGWGVSDEQVLARDEGRYIVIKVPYPTYFSPHVALRPELKLELRDRPIQRAPTICAVISFLNELAKIPPEVPQIHCLDVTENAADKLAALAWRVPARRAKVKRADDPNLVRHVYDLAALLPSVTEGGAFVSCLRASMSADAESSPLEEQPISAYDQIKSTLAILKDTPSYRDEYKTFVLGTVYGSVDSSPSFEEGLAAIESLLRHW